MRVMDGLGPSPLVQGATWETLYISGGRGPPPPIWGILWDGSLYPGESRAFEIGHYTLGCAVDVRIDRRQLIMQ